MKEAGSPMKFNIVRGRQAAPDRILVYGRPGVGKSTFAAGSPSPLFLDIEGGTNALDVARIVPKTYREVVDIIANFPDGFSTVVVDTIDALEKLIHTDLCKRHGWETIEAPGYGKGYAAAVDVFAEFLRVLDDLRARRGVEVVLLGHSVVRSITNPSGLDYTKHELAVHQKSLGIITAWCDTIGFADLEASVNKDEKVTLTGRRTVRLAPGAWDAKCRYAGMPASIPTSWADYARARAETAPKEQADTLYEQCLALLDAVDDRDDKIRKHLEASKHNPEALAKARARLSEMAGG